MSYTHLMKRALLLPCVFLSLFVAGCGGDDQQKSTIKGFEEQQVVGGEVFTLEQVAAQMELEGIKDVIRIPREQQAATRGAGDPIEVAIASSSYTAGAETITVGLHSNPEDAAEAQKGAKERIAKLEKVQREQYMLERMCNVVLTYSPGNDLRDLQLQEPAERLAKALKRSCDKPKKYPLGEEAVDPDKVSENEGASGDASAPEAQTPSAEPAPAEDK